MKYNLAKLWCFVFWHNYSLKRRITGCIRELDCLCCHKEFVMNDAVECVLPMDDDFKEMHDEMLGKIKRNL